MANTIATDPDTRAATRLRPGHLLVAALGVYTVLVGFLAFQQRGYINADFVGYATIAKRVAGAPGPWLTAYWSPLYSWLMAPFFALRAGDGLWIGRGVLILGGTLYLWALHLLARRFHDANPRRNLLITAGVLTCGVLQAAIWAAALLDPDLLADGLIFLCCALLLDPDLDRRPRRALAAGVVAGLAYLAKAYALPYLVFLLPLTLLLQAVAQRERTGACARRCLRIIPWFALGLLLVAGPWIATLSAGRGHLTISSAGAANHANMSPENLGKDPLWKPGLVADFIADPHLEPDWRPWQDREHLRHQLALALANARNCVGHVAGWLALLVMSLGVVLMRRVRSKAPMHSAAERFAIAWLLGAASLYCAGYCMVNLEARYIAPVVAPLLCLAALVALCGESATARQGPQSLARWRPGRAVFTGVLMVAVFAAQDLYRAQHVAYQHSQCSPIAIGQIVAERLAAERARGTLAEGPLASSWYHRGLYVAYAGDRVAAYLGTPRASEPADMTAQLNASGARCYLRWVDPGKPAAALSAIEAFVPGAPWVRVGAIEDPALAPWRVELYCLPDAQVPAAPQPPQQRIPK
jgi:hypothetical protein